MANWTFNELDQQIAAELQAQLPPVVFDAHAHLLRKSDAPQPPVGIWADGPEEIDQAVWRRHIGQQVGESRLEGGLLIPSPGCTRRPDRISAANASVIDWVAHDPKLRYLALVAPAMTARYYETLLNDAQFSGFKPYHVFSDHEPTFQAPLSTYLPEWTWAMAHARGLAITLHLVRDRALADPDNQREIRGCCEKYPRARLILAHAARGFHAPNTIRGLAALRELENVWFDASGVCEPEALVAILEAFGPRRLMWGSDFPVSEIRGRCVTVGDGFAWLQPDSVLWDKTGPQGHPTLVGLESLRALLTACDTFGLDASDRQDIFADNARRLFGLLSESGAKTQALYRRAVNRIPGGTQLLSKRPELMAPEQWPPYFREARGCETWDLDGRHYFDMSLNGIGSCLLGFRDPDVTRAVRRRLALGGMSSLNPPEEVELADRLCEIHPWAEQARFARCGGEICAVAARIARATTDRSLIAICGYHGWQDWYLAANLGDSDALRGHLLPGLDPLGVPRELRGTTVTFAQDDHEAFRSLIARHGERLAAVVMEPCRSRDPQPGFLELVRNETRRVGALLVFDEITIGWRLAYGGAHLKFGVMPDMAVFAKALGNGHPMAAVIGTGAAMRGAHDSFISSTYWTEGIGPVAALATLRKMREVDLPAYVARQGGRVMELWSEHGRRHGLALTVGGYACMPHFAFEHPEANALRTLYTQSMLERGFLAGTKFYATMAHNDNVVERYGLAIDAVFAEIAAVLDGGVPVAGCLRGPVAHDGFRRLTL